MTISSLVKDTGNLPGDGANFIFSFSPIKMSKSSEIKAFHVITATGVETEIFEGTGAAAFAITVASFPGTGTITYPQDQVTPIPSTEAILIKRVPTQEQPTLLNNQDGFLPKTHELQYDQFVTMILDLQEQLDRCVKMPITDALVTSVEVNPGALRVADAYFKITAAGTGVELAGLSAGTSATASSATPADVSVSAGAAGSGTDFSRDDHVHLVPTTVPRLATANVWAETQTHQKNDVVCAAALDLAAVAGNIFDLTTGTNTVTSILTMGVGTIVWLHTDVAITFTHHATNLVLPGAVDIVTQVGDILCFYEFATADWRLISFMNGLITNGRMTAPDFESAETWLDESAQITFTHGLGAAPSKIEVVLRANTATAQGWADNEEMIFMGGQAGSTIAKGFDVTADTTTIYITQAASIELFDHTSFALEDITDSEYDWVVRAWK